MPWRFESSIAKLSVKVVSYETHDTAFGPKSSCCNESVPTFPPPCQLYLHDAYPPGFGIRLIKVLNLSPGFLFHNVNSTLVLSSDSIQFGVLARGQYPKLWQIVWFSFLGVFLCRSFHGYQTSFLSQITPDCIFQLCLVSKWLYLVIICYSPLALIRR